MESIQLEENREYSGAQVNAANLGPLVKLTNRLEVHNEFKFKTGLNRDSMSFTPYGSCYAGGIYFCKMCDAAQWFNYAELPMFYYRMVTLPDDARVYVEEHKMKADKMVLGERVEIASSRELFDHLVEHGRAFLDPRHYVFDPSWFTVTVWERIMRNRNFELYHVPREYRTYVFWSCVLKDRRVKLNEYDVPADLVTPEILELAIPNGYRAKWLPLQKLTRENLCAFIRHRCLDDAALFPAALFDDSLLDVARPTRALRLLIAQKAEALHRSGPQRFAEGEWTESGQPPVRRAEALHRSEAEVARPAKRQRTK